MSLSFDTTTLPKPTEEKIKTLMAVVMQNGLMIQQLQLMVALRQKKIEEEEVREESRWQREEEARVEEEKLKELREEVRTMRGWTEEESQRYVEKFKGYRGDTRCRKCGWFGHRAYYCRRVEIEAKKEQRGGLCKNR